jgi:hypothetical protein
VVVPETGEKRNRDSLAGAVKKGEGMFIRGMIKEKGIENSK